MQNNNDKLKKRDSIISKQQHIIEELGENGVKQYNCTACRKTFRSRSQKYYHLNCNQLQNLIYQCEHCDKSFVRKSQWKYHNESHLSPVNECKKCQKTFSNPLAFKKHLSLHKVQPKLCPHCNKSFKKKASLEEHIAAQHLNQLQYGCAHCNKKYASKSTLQLHLQSHEKKRFECTFCTKQFQRNSILKLHLKRHNKTNVICNICRKEFSESGALARHRKIHEENILQYHCKLCDKNISRKDNMTRHLNTIHPDETFDNIVEIIRPIRSDLNEDPKQKIEEIEANDINILKDKHKNNPEKQVVIIENKLLQKPFEITDSTAELPKIIINTEYPLINQIKVITTVPTYEQEMFNENNGSTLQVSIQHTTTTNHHQQVDTEILEKSEAFPKNSKTQANCDLNLIPSKMFEQNEKYVPDNSLKLLNTSQNQTELQTETQDLFNNQKYLQYSIQEKQKQTLEINEPPKTQTVSSVIRSVGNVKHLTCHLETTATKPIKQISSEYKHKKYSHNNYNIDLYRKILGCDDDDDDDENNEQKEPKNYMPAPQTQDDLCENNMLKSTTASAVHWRKSFKNNYETWST